jgi:hypothetical protein
MKNFKPIILFIFLIFAVLIFSSCQAAVKPDGFEWSIESCIYEMTFPSGANHTVKADSNFNFTEPYATLHNESASIKFNADGTLSFKPLTKDVIKGTYTFENNYFEDEHSSVTLISITFENGDAVNANIYKNQFDAYALDLNYLGVRYTFSTVANDLKNQDMLDKRMNEQVLDVIKYYAYGGSGFIVGNLEKATVSQLDGKQYINIPKRNQTIEVNGNVPVYSLLLTPERDLAVLDEIYNGDCYLATSDEGVITLYYIEPAQTEGGLSASDIITKISDNSEKLIKIIISDHYLGSCIGSFLEIDDEFYIDKVIGMLENLALSPISFEEAQEIPKDSGLQTEISFVFSTEPYLSIKFTWVNGYIIDPNGSHYRCDGDFPDAELITNGYHEALFAKYPGTENGYAARSITLQDDPYGLWVSLIHQNDLYAGMPEESETVSGFAFDYPQNYRLIVYYHDNIYSLTDAYELGLIDKSDLIEIFTQYPEKLENLQKYAK